MKALMLLPALAASSLLALTASAFAEPVHGNVNPALRDAQDVGATDSAKVITVTVHLTMRDQAGFERALDALYDPASPRFHQWMSDAELKQYAAPAGQRAAVSAALERAGLKIVSTDKNGFSLRARGSVASFARAFNTEFHDFSVNGKTFRAHISEARLSGVEGSYVASLAGLDSHGVHPMLARAVDPKSGKARPPVPLADVTAAGLASMITPTALTAAKTYKYTTPGAKLPTGTFTGLVYNINPNVAVDFTPAQLQAAYNLTATYKAGIEGAGQTVVLLEGYGYPAAESDANAFAKMTGLPAYTAATFSIVYPEGKPTSPTEVTLLGWDTEIAIDIDSSHSIAPKAKTLIVATNGQDNEDMQASMQYIIDHKLGNVVSGSWEDDTDLIAGPDEQSSYETILQQAAAKGISFNFSTGDDGDEGIGSPKGAPGVPSVAPHATAIGGTALLNDVGTTTYYSVGWGDDFTLINDDGLVSPPEFQGFQGGGGGGASVFFKKPTWQSALPGAYRSVPDISTLADPYTGFPIVLDGKVQVGWGGTSLACPIFSAMWALANEKAGKSLGLAAATIAGLKTGIADVTAITNAADAHGSITTSKGTTTYAPAALFEGSIPGNQAFVSAIWPGSVAVAFAFGLDTSLEVTKGFDYATGYGTPQNANAFIAAAVAAGK